MSKKMKKSTKTTDEFPTNWDIDAYRTDYESEEHWLLRRHFMETHKLKFPEDRLVCLAQVFTNMEFMGCKYPADTMLLVAELTKEVAKDFRENRSKKLKRTFVAASDAAEARAKVKSKQQQSKQNQCDKNETYNNFHIDNENQYQMRLEDEQQFLENKRKLKVDNLFKNLKYGNFILFLIGGDACIKNSAKRCNMNYEEKQLLEMPRHFAYYLNDALLAEAAADNIKEAKLQALKMAMDILQKACYTIKKNSLFDVIKIEKNNNQVVCDVVKQETTETIFEKLNLTDKEINANNVGYKIMRKMGWAGGGLGRNTQGREYPVGYLLKNNREGLGSVNLDKNYFKIILQNYVESDDIRDLQFETSFLKEERKALHLLSHRFNLKSTSHGKGDNRGLTISKILSDELILKKVLIEEDQQYCKKYFVQVPETKADLFPNHKLKLELE